MATVISDLDGSVFLWGTNTFVPNAYSVLKRFYDAGNQIVFITQRHGGMLSMPSPKDTKKLLDELFPGSVILWNYSSPRIVINDQGAAAINHPQDAPWGEELLMMVQ